MNQIFIKWISDAHDYEIWTGLKASRVYFFLKSSLAQVAKESGWKWQGRKWMAFRFVLDAAASDEWRRDSSSPTVSRQGSKSYGGQFIILAQCMCLEYFF